MLACGAIAGPLFIGTVVVQDYTRAGVRPRDQPLSLLTLGDLGWIQVAAFVVSGLLYLGFAAGIGQTLRHGLAAVSGPPLIGGFGAGLVLAGVFLPDPAFGFPAGSPDGAAVPASWHAAVHDLMALVVFGCLVSSTVVFAHWFALRHDPVRATCCAVTGGVVLTLVVVSADPAMTSEALRAAVLVGWGWASWLAIRLRRVLTAASGE